MESEETPLGRAGLLVISLCVVLVFLFESFRKIIGVGALIGAAVAHFRAVLFVGRLDKEIDRNRFNRVQAEMQGIGPSMKIRFIFMQSLFGAVQVSIWAAVIGGVGLFFR